MQLIKNLNSKQRLAFFLTSIIIIIGIIYFIATYTNRIGKVEVTVQYAPYVATIELNNTKINNHSKTWLKPGIYKAVIRSDHFESIERDIEISNDYKYIVGTMNAADSEGKDYINSHKQEFIETEGIIGQALNQEGIIIKKKYPILNYLPINNRLYSISYAYTDEGEPIITVKSEPEYLDIAIQKMKKLKNVDLTIYQINFTAQNPFAFYTEEPHSSPEETIKKSFNLSGYKLSDGQNIADNYYAATIYKYDYNKDLIYGHYRVLLKKDNNQWHIISSPQPILTQQNTPDTPVDIINSANSLQP